VTVFDVSCHAPQSRSGEEEYVAATQVVLPRRGVFGLTRQRDTVIAEPNLAVFLEAGSTYSADHPSFRGDRCTVLVFDPAVLEDAMGKGRPAATRVSPTVQLTALTLLTTSKDLDDFEHEEASLLLLTMLASGDRRPWTESRPDERQRKRVNDVCELLASRPEAPWRLATVGAAVHLSPFHLSRQFREVTGTTLGRYLLRLRLSIALDRIVEGEPSLSRIASDVGFAHHSHLTERFRSVFGITPREVRRGQPTAPLWEIARRPMESGWRSLR
jgi:AraC family transcriptional regulator